MIALVDVNNFYVSCERLFNPKLINRPTVVLSNNDGCIISRSEEAKFIGIKMGAPLFKMQSLINQHDIKVLSSNYPLYADISSRVMRLISEFTDYQEIYSIDECFISLIGHKNHQDIAATIKKELWINLRMPVCIGIGPTKVLAKLGNHCAKKQSDWNGICATNLLPDNSLNNLMDKFSVNEVWGVGKNLTQKLNVMNINSVLDLKKSNAILIKSRLNINVARIIYELNGIICFPLEQGLTKKKQIVTSRSFGRAISNYPSLVEAVTTFVVKATLKLRNQGSLCTKVSVFIRSSPFKKEVHFYQNIITIPFSDPTNNTKWILKEGLKGLSVIYRRDILYVKCGIILSDLIDEKSSQRKFYFVNTKKDNNLTFIIDKINKRFDSNTLRLATQPLSPLWSMKQLKKSRSYTTSWKELLVAN
ncbi:MAG: Y-family DNA polymerase [Methylophilaceae bacterium]|nr:Y-family DNA polymerase [Methylophilaceae bacterium]